MLQTGYRSSTLVVFGLFLAVTVLFLVRRLMKDGWRIESDEIKLARLRRVYGCFLLIDSVSVFIAAAMGGVSLMSKSQETLAGLGMGAGMLLAATVWIGLPVAAFGSLRVLDHRAIRMLWLLTILFLASLWFLMDRIAEAWLLVFAIVFVLSTAFIAVNGLKQLRNPAGGAPPE